MSARIAIQPPLQRWELAEIFRLLSPGQRYLGDPPEEWTAQTLLEQLRVKLHQARGGSRHEMGDAIRVADEAFRQEARP